MKIYRVKRGIVIERNGEYFALDGEEWDRFVNDDSLLEKLVRVTTQSRPTSEAAAAVARDLLAPVESQEIWACGVTYLRSKLGRQEESRRAGGGDFYARVYDAERPELFFKATAHRTVGPGGVVRVRRDSSWNVPEPELTLAVTSSGRIIGYTIGNDMSSRSIEGENPLYLPQAKTYDGCCAIGPCILVTDEQLPGNTLIQLTVQRDGMPVVEGDVSLDQMKRRLDELVAFLFRECSFPHGCLLLTGTGILPASDFTLARGDEIRITIAPIGTLTNTVG